MCWKLRWNKHCRDQTHSNSIRTTRKLLNRILCDATSRWAFQLRHRNRESSSWTASALAVGLLPLKYLWPFPKSTKFGFEAFLQTTLKQSCQKKKNIKKKKQIVRRKTRLPFSKVAEVPVIVFDLKWVFH